MIRTFDWRDVGLVRALSQQGVGFHSEAALTRGLHPFQAALRGYLAPGSSAATYVWRPNGDQEHAQPAFAQLTCQSGSSQAWVYYLAPASVANGGAAWAALLEQLAVEAGSRGAFNLIAEANEDCAEFDQLRSSGFAVYARQAIFSLSPRAIDSAAGLNLRPRTSRDTFDIQALYNNVVPRLVQQVEPAPAEAGSGYVLQVDDEVVVYLDVIRGPIGIWVQPYLHPEVQNSIADVIAAFLQLETRHTKKPVYVCVRSYQHWLRGTLTDRGFGLWGQQAVMVKRLAARIQEPRFRAIPAIEGTEVEISSPFVKTSLVLRHREEDDRSARHASRPRQAALKRVST